MVHSAAGRPGDRPHRPIAGRDAGDGGDGVGQPAAGDPRSGAAQRHGRGVRAGGGGALSQRGHGSGAVGRAGPGPAPRGVVFAPLTEREYEVVEAVAEGLDNAGVARRLFMSEGTVRNHISSILAKLGLRNRTQVAVAYYRSARAG